jgi:hypothetical protein
VRVGVKVEEEGSWGEHPAQDLTSVVGGWDGTPGLDPGCQDLSRSKAELTGHCLSQ